ncbi:MAG: hypothetical protein HND56_02775 [Pseudomonadota bacterium]|nr:hypothetical protein [Pseudomonadota bacterium]QKK04675.1 MAG: hypothetical protein HND56_02775 [Pseudomonadota bacterium]|tara:strand:+ start:1410 stop:1685 length:276 start_codon:yes stop_codon:yes gene_type:complete
MSIKSVFLYNVTPDDHISINGRVIKSSGKKEADCSFDGLRVIFNGDFQSAKAQGIEERIDSLFLNLDDIRAAGPQEYMLLGRKKKVAVKVG